MPNAPRSHKARMRALEPKTKERRPTAAQRGYGAAWRRLRQYKLNRSPLCEVEGCDRPATDVDHIVPLARGGDNSMGNLQALCHSHHSQKTAREDGGFGR